MAKLPWTLWPHWWAHLDECLQMWQLFRHGDKEFPDVSDADVDFKDMADPELNKPFAELWEKGIIPLGVVDDSPFNEHAGAEEGVERTVGMSASDLMAHALKIAEYPELKPLLQAISQNDLTGAGNEFYSLAKSLELRWQAGVSAQDVLQWMFYEFDLRVESLPKATVYCYSIDEMLAAYIYFRYGNVPGGAAELLKIAKGKSALAVAKQFGVNKKGALRRLIFFSTAKAVGVGIELLSLSKSLELRWQAGVSAQDVLKWMFYEFDLRFKEQERVWSPETLQLINKSCERVEVKTRGGRKLVLWIARTDDNAVVSRLRAQFKPDALLRIGPKTGYVALLMNRDSNVYIGEVARLVRAEELRRLGLPAVNARDLAYKEKIKGLAWFLHRNQRKAINLLKGGDRARMTPKSLIPEQLLVKLVVQGLEEDRTK